MAKVKVFGIGGEGLLVADKLAQIKYDNTSIYGIDSCLEALNLYFPIKNNRCYIGENVTHGLGAGGNLELAEKAVLSSESEIKKCIYGAEIAIIIAALGGGIGQAASTIIADWCKYGYNALTIGIVTMPMKAEGIKRNEKADNYITNDKPVFPFNVLCCFALDDYYIDKDRKSIRESFERANDDLCAWLGSFLKKIDSDQFINDRKEVIRALFETRDQLYEQKGLTVHRSEETRFG